jgi:hypothetical protein
MTAVGRPHGQPHGNAKLVQKVLEYASYLMRRTQSGTALPHEKAKKKDKAPNEHLM